MLSLSLLLILYISYLGGEAKLGIPVGISFGTIYGDCETYPNDCSGPVPYRTFVMLISLICHFLISTLTHYLFVEEKISQKYDFFGCYRVR